MTKLSPGSLEFYKDLYNRCELNKDKTSTQRVETCLHKITLGKSKYDTIEKETGMPWWLVAAIHGLEASYKFTTFLHNGDPLKNAAGVNLKTTHVPKNKGPFNSWEDAAIDALKDHHTDKIKKWNIEQCLMFAERYNGLGYLNHHPKVLSPYLWSGTNHYIKGKYIADGIWSDTIVSEQTGVAAIAKALNIYE